MSDPNICECFSWVNQDANIRCDTILDVTFSQGLYEDENLKLHANFGGILPS